MSGSLWAVLLGRQIPGATWAFVGADRYATAALVAVSYFPVPTVVGLANGLSFADAVVGAPGLAAASGPMLLTDPNNLPLPISQYLGTVRSTLKRLIIFGGTLAVSPQVASQAQAAA